MRADMPLSNPAPMLCRHWRPSLPATRQCLVDPMCAGMPLMKSVLMLCREKVQALEAKLRGAMQDKANTQMEKAALERELKGLRNQAGKLTKVG